MLKVEQTSHNTNKSFILHFTNLSIYYSSTVVHCVNNMLLKWFVCVHIK